MSVPSGAYMDIIARQDTAPGNNPDFVKGLKLLQRRDRVLQVVQKGQGSIGNDQPIGPAYGADWCEALAIGPYDPDQAKHHLQKSGITSAKLDVAEVGPGLTDICLLLQRECAKVGFDLQVNKVPNDGLLGRGLAEDANACLELEHAAERQHHDDPGLQVGRTMERDRVEERAF